MSDLLAKIQYWGVLTVILLVPLFFLPTTQDPFDFNKLVLLIVASLVLLGVWAARNFIDGKFTFIATSFDLPVLIIAAVFVISTFVRTPNKIDAFLIPGTTSVILSLTALYFLITQISQQKVTGVFNLRYGLIFSGFVTALVFIFAQTHVLQNINGLPAYLKSDMVTFAGTLLAHVLFLVSVLPVAFGEVVSRAKSRRQDDQIAAVVFGVVVLVMVVSIVMATRLMLPGKPTALKLLPLAAGWTVAVETLKVSPLGMGPGNYLSAFNQFRPVSFNQTDFWNVRFVLASNWYLHVFTISGIIGLAALLFLVWRIVNSGSRLRFFNPASFAFSLPSSSKPETWLRYGLYLILLLFLFFPAPLLLQFTFYVLLALLASTFSYAIKWGNRTGPDYLESGKVITGIILGTVLLVSITVLVFGSKAYAAEMYYKQALDAAAKNDGKAMHELLVKAIQNDNRVDRYRIAYSQANLAIANALARNQNLTDKDRQTISQLIQLSIKEAQVAVALNNKLSTNWENLALVYRAIIPLAKGSDQFAVAAYAQAIALEPVNPILRLNLGGVHYTAGRFDDADKSFELAVAAKPDWANAHYNLAAALRQKGDPQSLAQAKRELETVLSLVTKDSQDYQTAQSALDDLNNAQPAKTQQQKNATTGKQAVVPTQPVQGSSLQTPQPSTAPVLKPQIELPNEVTLPTVSPSPAPVTIQLPSPTPGR